MKDFFKKFRRKEDSDDGGIEVNHATIQLPPELGRALAAAFQGGKRRSQKEDRTALFMIKDHPEIEAAFKAYDEFGKFLTKQLDDLLAEMNRRQAEINAKHDEHHKMVWNNIEEYMKGAGLWPEGYSKQSEKEHLSEANGVMYLARRQDE